MSDQYPYHLLMGRPFVGPHVDYFAGTDTKEHLEKSLRSQPIDWHYRNKHVEYRYNTHGFRAPEFDEVDWSNSIVIFGCSQTQGIGLAESETVSAQLEEISGIPVINLGVGGTSMHWSYVNNLILKKHLPMPLGIINYWTSCKRMTWYGVEENVSIMPVVWKHFYARYYLQLMKLGLSLDDIDHDDNFKAQIIRDTVCILWENTRYAEATWIQDTASALECKLINSIDYARDLGHHGPQTARLAAEYFAEQLNL